MKISYTAFWPCIHRAQARESGFRFKFAIPSQLHRKSRFERNTRYSVFMDFLNYRNGVAKIITTWVVYSGSFAPC